MSAGRDQKAARRLAEEILEEILIARANAWKYWRDEADAIVPLILSYGLAREQETLEKAAKLALAHANRWANEPLRSYSRMQACLSVGSAIRALMKPREDGTE